MGCTLHYQMIPGARTPTLCMQVQAVRAVHAVHAVHQMTARTPFLLWGDMWGSVLFAMSSILCGACVACGARGACGACDACLMGRQVTKYTSSDQ